MATKYKDAPEVRMMAGELVGEFPALLSHLANYRVVYAWRDKAQAKNGKTVLGTASLVTGRNALLATPHSLGPERWSEGAAYQFFVIEIAADEWKHLDECQRKALVFHELLHCGEDDDCKPMIVPHDVEEFSAVAEHFGLWKSDLEQFAQSLKRSARPVLPFDEDGLEASIAQARA